MDKQFVVDEVSKDGLTRVVCYCGVVAEVTGVSESRGQEILTGEGWVQDSHKHWICPNCIDDEVQP